MTATELNNLLLEARAHAKREVARKTAKMTKNDIDLQSALAQVAGYPASEWKGYMRKQEFNAYIEANQ